MKQTLWYSVCFILSVQPHIYNFPWWPWHLLYNIETTILIKKVLSHQFLACHIIHRNDQEKFKWVVKNPKKLLILPGITTHYVCMVGTIKEGCSIAIFRYSLPMLFSTTTSSASSWVFLIPLFSINSQNESIAGWIFRKSLLTYQLNPLSVCASAVSKHFIFRVNWLFFVFNAW